MKRPLMTKKILQMGLRTLKCESILGCRGGNNQITSKSENPSPAELRVREGTRKNS